MHAEGKMAEALSGITCCCRALSSRSISAICLGRSGPPPSLCMHAAQVSTAQRHLTALASPSTLTFPTLCHTGSVLKESPQASCRLHNLHLHISLQEESDHFLKHMLVKIVKR